MTPLEARNAKLDAAKALILRGWCQGAYARRADGTSVDIKYIREKSATCFCAKGAIHRVEDKTSDSAVLRNKTPAIMALEAAVEKITDGKSNAIRYNDAPGRTKYEVAALFDHAKETPL